MHSKIFQFNGGNRQLPCKTIKKNKKKAKADTVFTSFVYSKKSVGSLYVGLESGAEIVVAPC